MKRVELIQQLTRMGCAFIRHGGKHDWYQNPRTKMCQPVPRHREINEYLARSVIKRPGHQEVKRFVPVMFAVLVLKLR